MHNYTRPCRQAPLLNAPCMHCASAGSCPAVRAAPAAQSVDEGGGLAKWASRPAPRIASMYWRLPEGSTLRDVLLSVRADEVGGGNLC